MPISPTDLQAFVDRAAQRYALRNRPVGPARGEPFYGLDEAETDIQLLLAEIKRLHASPAPAAIFCIKR